MFTARVARGAFTRIASLATAGAKSLIKRIPKSKMDMSSLTLGRMLKNPRVQSMRAGWNAPSLSSIRQMTILGGFGSNPSTATKYMTGLPFFTFAKTSGMHPNHASSDGIGLALHKARHTNVI